ncbi:MAG TPA: response regulator [Pirellulaceae bacterium]|jgi:CheY-like chemotaxis protein
MVQSTGFSPFAAFQPAFQRGSLAANSESALNSQSAPNPEPARPMPERHLRVVIVDDNYDANVALARLLERSGFEVAGRAYDGISGLNVIKSAHPDVAILDIAMPALDGFGLAERVRSEVESPPRMVALTGFGTEADESKARSVGFDAYFRKPAEWSKLEALLHGYEGGAG